ncbi:hypothetical protein JHK86_055266 [Glycine max]|nr:hypothetical protein JHK86_055266 [Glycine max]
MNSFTNTRARKIISPYCAFGGRSAPCFILRNHSEMALRKRARADDIPSSSTPAPSSATIRPDVQSSQTLVPMLQSLFRGQFIIMHNLRELAHHRPIITMEHFLE